MYKFFLYIVLIISYLGLAKALSPSELGIQFLKNERGFSKLVKGNQLTVILTDTHATGFLMKTYYQKYRIISGYELIEDIIVRTNKEFARKNKEYIGLSIYRRNGAEEEFLPLPPGSLYINNSEFGEWKLNKEGQPYWKFSKVFKNFPKFLGWGKFRPNMEFYQQLRSSVSLNRPYFGPNHEFGPNGPITQKNFPHFFNKDRMKKVDMKTLLLDYFKENF